MKVATFDIECTSLDAVGAGFILCVVVKPLGRKPLVLRYDDPKHKCAPGKETALLRRALGELAKYDLLVGHNTESFDWDYLKSRAVELGVPFHSFFACIPLSYDTCKAFRRTKFKTVPNFIGKPSATLDMAVDFFGIKQAKTKIYPREHWRTVWGDQRERDTAMRNLIQHCLMDVAMNEQLFLKLLPLDAAPVIKRFK